MTDTNVIKLAQPGTFTDSLTEILRNGARALLMQAVEAEAADFLGRYADLKTEAGRQRVVRHWVVSICGWPPRARVFLADGRYLHMSGLLMACVPGRGGN